ncbi:hypothetical protein VNO77_27121 [Canavalia gladiata]|uniref:Uncharacterized protein n=1 Tax=Canavalia gladiata TaxID=3824 RepID=A0AAN9KWN1_CANGL
MVGALSHHSQNEGISRINMIAFHFDCLILGQLLFGSRRFNGYPKNHPTLPCNAHAQYATPTSQKGWFKL